MKRSFYQMLGVEPDADQAQIDIGFAQVMAKLDAGALRGVAASVIEGQLIRAGYQILSSPEQRAQYDAKLLTAEPGVAFHVFPDDPFRRRRPGVGSVLAIMFVAVVATVVYRNVSKKMDDVKHEHAQALERHKEEQARASAIDVRHLQTPGLSAANDPQKH